MRLAILGATVLVVMYSAFLAWAFLGAPGKEASYIVLVRVAIVAFGSVGTYLLFRRNSWSLPILTCTWALAVIGGISFSSNDSRLFIGMDSMVSAIALMAVGAYWNGIRNMDGNA